MLNDYLEKLQRKPARERERIAWFATGISFLIVLVIWLVSFNETNKIDVPENVETPGKIQDLREELGAGRSSIEEMLQQVPAESNFQELEQNPAYESGQLNMPGDNGNTETENEPREEPVESGVPQLP